MDLEDAWKGVWEMYFQQIFGWNNGRIWNHGVNMASTLVIVRLIDKNNAIQYISYFGEKSRGLEEGYI